jgi:phosphoglycolate phosphatase
MLIECILFDWSGTISDDRRVVYAANMLMREAYGIPPVSFEDWVGTVTLTVWEHFAQLGITDAKDEVWAHYGRRLSEVAAAGMAPVAYADAAETLSSLADRGFRIGVVSSHPEENLLAEARTYGLHGWFGVIMGGSRDKAADMTRIAASLGARPERTLYVGDTVHDIRHAKKAGARSAGITTGYHSSASLAAESPDCLLGSLSEVLEVV